MLLHTLPFDNPIETPTTVLSNSVRYQPSMEATETSRPGPVQLEPATLDQSWQHLQHMSMKNIDRIWTIYRYLSSIVCNIYVVEKSPTNLSVSLMYGLNKYLRVINLYNVYICNATISTSKHGTFCFGADDKIFDSHDSWLTSHVLFFHLGLCSFPGSDPLVRKYAAPSCRSRCLSSNKINSNWAWVQHNTWRKIS